MITAALIPAAGRGQRMGLDTEKQFLLLGGKPLLAHTLGQFEATPDIDRIVVIVPQGREPFATRKSSPQRDYVKSLTSLLVPRHASIRSWPAFVV
jgi:2-C-methyl-D-erythritol 4-phosphate cytidylyltransferase